MEQEFILDLWSILVDTVFGSVLLSGLAIAVVILIIGALMRISFPTIMVLIVLFAISFSAGYIGTFGIALWYIAIGLYFIAGVVNFMNRAR